MLSSGNITRKRVDFPDVARFQSAIQIPAADDRDSMLTLNQLSY
jgi:hypothetical protein